MSDRLVFEIFVLEKLGEKKGKTREQGWKKFLFLFRVGVGWEHNYHKKAEVEEENSDKKYVARTCLRNINNISGIFIWSHLCLHDLCSVKITHVFCTMWVKAQVYMCYAYEGMSIQDKEDLEPRATWLEP